jgi:hypothetical protein
MSTEQLESRIAELEQNLRALSQHVEDQLALLAKRRKHDGEIMGNAKVAIGRLIDVSSLGYQEKERLRNAIAQTGPLAD